MPVKAGMLYVLYIRRLQLCIYGYVLYKYTKPYVITLNYITGSLHARTGREEEHGIAYGVKVDLLQYLSHCIFVFYLDEESF